MLEEVGIPRLVVGGLGSGSGKTSISLGLTAALRARGRTVQTFKVGADFIDTAYLAHASRRPCRNLDSWLLGPEGVRRSLAHGAIGADCVIVEGGMGVLDGHGMAADTPPSKAREFPGSTLDVARIISAPVVLVVDAWAMGETAAAAALGIKQLDSAGSVIGVILNNVPNDYRRRVIEDAIWSLARMPVLGALPHIPSVRIPELRTGLLPLLQNPHVDEAIIELGDAVAKDCDLDLVERLMEAAHPVQPTPRRRAPDSKRGRGAGPHRCRLRRRLLLLLPREPRAARGRRRGDRHVLAARGSRTAARPRPHLPRRRHLGGVRAAARRQSVVPRVASGARTPTAFPSTRRAAGSSTRREPCAPATARRTRWRASSLSTSRWRRARCTADIATSASRQHRCSAPRARVFAATSSTSAALLSGADCLNPAYTMHDGDGEPLGCEGWTDPLMLASFIHLHFGQEQELAGRLVAAARESLDQRTHATLAGRGSRSTAPV